MNVFFKLVYLLLLKATTEAVNGAGGTGIVFHPQTPQLVLHESHLTLNCSFDIEDELDQVRVRVNWRFSKTQRSDCQGVKLSSGLANKTVDLGTNDPVTQWTGHTWSNLRDITSDTSGWYFCEVVLEIPDYQQSCSRGIEVNITTSLRSSPSTRTTAKNVASSTLAPVRCVNMDCWVWLIVGAGSLVLIAVLVGVWILCRKKRCQNKENPIYENMRPASKGTVTPHPSPRPRTQLIPSILPSSVPPGTPKIL